MRTRQPYTPCKLFYDGAHNLKVGHFLKTPAGSAYLVQAIRQNKRREYRKHLDCLRWPIEEIPKRARVHPLYWYPRKKKAARRLSSFGSAA
jgi:hypothetical protein